MKTSDTSTKTKWTIDHAHSELGFKVKHLMITNVKGVFKDFEADIYTQGDDFSTAEIELRIKVASIDTNDESRNNHLKSPDFFDSEHHKEIVFVGKKLERGSGEDNYELYGNLVIRGVSVPVKLDVKFEGMMKDPWQNLNAGFLVEGKISRRDWQLNWNTTLETGGVLVGDEVRISCEIQLVKQS